MCFGGTDYFNVILNLYFKKNLTFKVIFHNIYKTNYCY